ncbi:ATP-dependent zinc protease family protein [Lysobacter sp. CA196]|uniref:ATP-dependent zinc protease family protein n=1 Tax=Lysobacter sp. CA196 TaxID=3455606 RepID=UPI003F8D5215
MSSKIVLGWREAAALPALGLAAIRAKIDTGARSSALHVDSQWRFVEAGMPWVGFELTLGAPGAAKVEARVEARAPVYDERWVTDSGGHRSSRVFIRTVLSLAGTEREIEINLADRRGMRFPMLLGRTAVTELFTVDPSRSFLHGRVRRRHPRV